MVSEFDAPEKDAIFNRIAERKDELANQLLAHPEHTESILSEVATLKGLVRTVDAQNYDGAMSLMEARKEQLKSELLSLDAKEEVPVNPATKSLPQNGTDDEVKILKEAYEKTKPAIDESHKKANDDLVAAKKVVTDAGEKATEA
jgi:hypothetical protein